MRRPPSINGLELQPPPVKPVTNPNMITEHRKYELITPLFGGGTEPQKADAVTVIRGSAIRGCLRFWWRACRGGQFDGSLARMKDAEDQLWGAASTEKSARPSQVTVAVVAREAGTPERPYETKTKTVQKWNGLAYAAFPLAPDNDKAPGEVRRGVSFTLRITYPSEKQAEVAAALWAWETFGGLGARTRRGFGALRLVDVNGAPVAMPLGSRVEAEILAGLQRHVVVGSWPENVPHLPQAWASQLGRITPPQADVDQAWTRLISALKSFRQDRRASHCSGTSSRPGRSKWPEPDAIRRLCRTHSPGHNPTQGSPDKFPRAAFGLPIIFKFKSDDERAGDPKSTTLQGQADGRRRHASPLILRPLACANGQAVGLAIVLQGSLLPRMELKGAPGNPLVEAKLTPAEAASIPPLSTRTSVDVLTAYLRTL